MYAGTHDALLLLLLPSCATAGGTMLDVPGRVRTAASHRPTCSSSSLSLNFLMATTSLVTLCRHLVTTPYVPSPMAPRFS